jgi:hypothetical protein
MENSLPSEGKLFPRASAEERSWAFERLASFRTTYVAIVAFVLLYVFSVKGVEQALGAHFRAQVAQAVRVEPGEEAVAEGIAQRVNEVVRGSRWVRWGGVNVSANVFGANGRPLYVGRRVFVSAQGGDSPSSEAGTLPVTTDVSVTVPHNALLSNGILVSYAAFLLWLLYAFNRRLVRREAELFDSAVAARDAAALRAQEIDRELEEVRRRIDSTLPAEQQQAERIRALRAERRALQDKLSALARREEELLAKASRTAELDEERHALEEMLEEALADLGQKDQQIQQLNQRLKRADREAPAGGRVKESEQLERRLRTLYKNLEIDDRAISDLTGLRDAGMQLKAEEAMKRLSDEAENAAIRRKVGGLPPHLTIFELGFAGKGRIYYTNGVQRRFRILAVGAKNTQKPDLEYLSRLPKS